MFDDRSTTTAPASWLDASTQAALDLIAEGVTELAGFEVAAISIAREHEFEVIAVSGSETARTLLTGSRTEIALTLDLLERAEHWGSLRFVPHELSADYLDGHGWIPDFEPLDTPDAWHPEDMLFAPIFDTSGRLRGTLAVDLPVGGLRPGREQRRLLERYSLQAGRAVLTALDRDALAAQLQMANRARIGVREASRELSLDLLLVECQEELIAGFRARGIWLHVLDQVPGGAGSTVSPSVGSQQMPAHLVQVAERAARRAWAAKRGEIVAANRLTGLGVTATQTAAILDYLTDIGISSVLFVPIGEGPACLGAMVLTRGPDDPEWTEAELAVALDVGTDLGHAIAHARAFAREQRLVRELQEVDHYKTELVATLSHELKTPLTSILGHLGLLEEHDLPDEGRRSLAAIDRSAQRIVRVVDDLMLLARVGDPVHEIVLRPVDLGAVVDDVLELMEVAVTRRAITVRVERPDHPVLAAGDADEVDRVVANIIGNAVKYTPTGGAITITVGERAGQAVFACADTGMGISSEDRPLLFREFFRSTNPSALSLPGTGLGLAIVERIVKRHGGQVQVESQVGRGSTFTVTLPRASGGGAAAAGPGAGASTTAGVPASPA